MPSLFRSAILSALAATLPATVAADAPVCVEISADARTSWATQEMATLESAPTADGWLGVADGWLGGMSGISLADDAFAVAELDRDPSSDLPALWCASPDDPRCTPARHDGDGPGWTLADGRVQASGSSRVRVAPANASDVAPTPIAHLVSATVVRRVERPPRA